MRRKGSLIGDLFNMDVLFGILLGIALPFVLWVATQDIPVAVDKAPVQPDNVVHAYQDLIAGILALIGAAGAVGAVIYQIRDARKMEEERRYRQMYAARAMMSHALASLCEYAKQSCAELRGVLGDARPPKDPEQVKLPDSFKLPDVSSLPIESLQRLLQFGDKDIQDTLAGLMGHLQIQQSRLQNRDGHVIDNIIFARWYYILIADSLEIYARASALFDYARSPDGKVPSELTKDSFYSAAQNCGFWQPKWEQLNRFIEQERPQS